MTNGGNKFTLRLEGCVYQPYDQEPVQRGFTEQLSSGQYPHKSIRLVSEREQITPQFFRWLVIANRSGEGLSKQPTDEERERIAGQVLEVWIDGQRLSELLPAVGSPEGHTLPIRLADGVRLEWAAKDPHNPCVASVTALEA